MCCPGPAPRDAARRRRSLRRRPPRAVGAPAAGGAHSQRRSPGPRGLAAPGGGPAYPAPRARRLVPGMAAAALWGLAVGAAGVVGAALGAYVQLSHRLVGTVMALGVGALLGAVGFELLPAATDAAGRGPVTASFLAGALAFTLVDRAVARRGGGRRRAARLDAGAGLALLAGAALDALPESLALGIDLFAAGRVSPALVAGLLLSNVPEGLASAAGLARAGHPPRRVLSGWSALALATAAAAAVGHRLARVAPPGVEGAALAFAAGAVVAMLAETMVPDAFAEGGRVVGVATAAGLLITWSLAGPG